MEIKRCNGFDRISMIERLVIDHEVIGSWRRVIREKHGGQVYDAFYIRCIGVFLRCW